MQSLFSKFRKNKNQPAKKGPSGDVGTHDDEAKLQTELANIWTPKFIFFMALSTLGAAFYKKSLMKGPVAFEEEEPWVMKNLNKVFIYGICGALMMAAALSQGIYHFAGKQKTVLMGWTLTLLTLCVVFGGFGTKICNHGALNLMCLIIIFLVFFGVRFLIHQISKLNLKAKNVAIFSLVVFLFLTPVVIKNSLKWRSGIRGQKIAVSKDFGCNFDLPLVDWDSIFIPVKKLFIGTWALRPCPKPRKFAYIDTAANTFVMDCRSSKSPRYTLYPFISANLTAYAEAHPNLTIKTEQYAYTHSHTQTFEYTGPVPLASLKHASVIDAVCGSEKLLVVPPFYRDEEYVAGLKGTNKEFLKSAAASKVTSAAGKSPNIVMLYIDTISRPNLFRSLPKTIRFLEEFARKSESPEFPATISQFLRIHAFVHHTEPNSRGMFTGAQNMTTLPFLWEEFRNRAGYATMIADNSCVEWARKYGGRSSQPDFSPNSVWCHNDYTMDPTVDYNLLKGPNSVQTRCISGLRTDEIMFEFAKTFDKTFADVPKFSLLKFTEGHEVTTRVVTLIDDDLAQYLKTIDYNNTVVFLLSDHGNHMGYLSFVSFLYSFHVESILPGLFVMAPKWITQNPLLSNHLDDNLQRFITPSDFHATLKDFVFDWSNEPRTKEEISLLSEEVPLSRDCKSGYIPDDVCHCY